MSTHRSRSGRTALTGLLVVSITAACSTLIGLDDYRVEEPQSAAGGSAGMTSSGGGGRVCADRLDCDDGIDCTEDSCEEGTCRHVPNDALCSGENACGPSVCNVIQGCRLLEPSEVTLVDATTRNGSFETGMLPDPFPWTTDSNQDLVVIYDCTSPSTPCEGIHAFISASHGDRLLWLGGVDDHHDSAYQFVDLPAGTVGLRIVADLKFQTEETGPSNQDVFEIWLRGISDPMPLIESPLHRSLSRDAQGSSAQWSRDVTLVDDADVRPVAGRTVRISFESTSDDEDLTDFFVDNIRITATVCE